MCLCYSVRILLWGKLSFIWFLFSLVLVIIMQVPESQSHSYCLPLLSTDQLSIRWSISSSSPVFWARTPSPSVIYTPPHSFLSHLRICLPCLTNLRVSPGKLRRWHAQSCTAKSSSGLYIFHSDTHQNSVPEWKLLTSAKGYLNRNHLRQQGRY